MFLGYVTLDTKAGVLNLFPVKYPHVIKQSTWIPQYAVCEVALHAQLHSLGGKAVDFTLLHHNNARSGKIYANFSIGTYFPLG